MVLLARYELVGETELEVEYRFGNPDMDRRLVFRKRDRHCSATGGMHDTTAQTVAGKILSERHSQGNWPASGTLTARPVPPTRAKPLTRGPARAVSGLSGEVATAGGTDVDFWRNRAATVRANAGHGGTPVEVELERLAAAERYERLYSAAARMLTGQGPASTRADWPEERRQRWHELEMLLATQRRVDPPGTPPDPARHLASRQDATGRPVGIAEAVRDWERQLDAPPIAAAGDPDRGVVVLPGPLYLIVKELLNELAARLTPGRPVGAVGDSGADLSELVHDLADQLRAAVPTQRSSRHPARLVPKLRTPQLLSAGLPLPAAAERLATAARLAAEATPTPERLAATLDFSVRHDAAVAAVDVLAGLDGTATLGWRECYDGIRPDVHMVSSYRWDPDGRPVGLAEEAAEIRRMARDLPLPWRPGPADALPESTARTSWMALRDQAALVSAELLDELSARLRPGRWIGTIHLAAFPLQDFLHGRLRRTAIAI